MKLEKYKTKERMLVKVFDIPFYIPAGTVLESHPDNIQAAFREPRPDGKVFDIAGLTSHSPTKGA